MSSVLAGVENSFYVLSLVSILGMTLFTGCSECEADHCLFREIILSEGFLEDKRIDQREYDYLTSSIVPTSNRPDALKLLHNTSIFIEEAVNSIVAPDSIHLYTIEHPKPAKISTVHLFLETSLSMKGYANAYTDEEYRYYRNFLSELNTRPGTSFEVFTVGQTVKPDIGSESWSANFRDTEAYKGSSPLHLILMNIAKDLNEQKVALFMTDALLSYPGSEIEEYRKAKVGKHKNLEEYDGLEDNLTKTLKESLFNHGYGVNIYKLSVPFNGKYYNYANDDKDLYDPKRPLYIFAMGKDDNLKEINRLWIDRMQPTSYEVLEFTSSIERNAFPRVLTRLGKKGEWQLDGEEFNTLRISRDNLDGELEFAMLTYLPSLPLDLQELPATKANFIDPSAKVFVTDIVEANLTAQHPDWKNLISDERQINNLYHSIVKCSVETNKLHPGENIIRFELRRDVIGGWVNEISIEDDLSIRDLSGKTWRFDRFIEAFKKAFKYDSAVYIGEITIKVE